MVRTRKTQGGFFLFCLAFVGSVLALLLLLVLSEKKEKQIYQFAVSLKNVEYNEKFLEELEKLPGIVGFTPVLEIPVRLKIEDYQMETILYGLKLSDLNKEVESSRETPLGTIPALVFGEKALEGMADSNGHQISGEQQRKILADLEGMKGSFFLQEAEVQKERPFLAAAVLGNPKEGIYLSYEQAEALLSEKGQRAVVTKGLLTIRGKKNKERAEAYFL